MNISELLEYFKDKNNFRILETHKEKSYGCKSLKISSEYETNSMPAEVEKLIINGEAYVIDFHCHKKELHIWLIPSDKS